MKPGIIELDGRIYRPGAVMAAVREYSKVAELKAEKKGGAVVVTFMGRPAEYEDTLEMEFCNYVLWKMRN